MTAGEAGTSSQRGAALIVWVKTVLAMPDLVARLAGLYTTLSIRLALQDSLLSLSGRLDMVLSPIEMRSSVTPAPLQVITLHRRGSEDKDEQMDVEVEVESGDNAGSIEDVELGASSDDEGSEDDDDDDDNDDGDEHQEGLTMNGFIDDEAEEYSGRR
ncbi:hypothetical protein C8J57DRAFT_1417269 [Mycena rebaudengoi]|nr:hypothetical protein C8J57DRAFT_1417269 [Mycena rebaudengoi]